MLSERGVHTTSANCYDVIRGESEALFVGKNFKSASRAALQSDDFESRRLSRLNRGYQDINGVFELA